MQKKSYYFCGIMIVDFKMNPNTSCFRNCQGLRLVTISLIMKISHFNRLVALVAVIPEIFYRKGL